MFYFNPLSQFEVFLITSNNFLYSTIDILSISLLSNFLIGIVWLLISLKFLLNQVQKRTKSLSVWSLIVLKISIIIKTILITNLNLKRKEYFIPLLLLIFFILLSNFIGLIPYSFTITSSFLITFFIALSYYIGLNILSIYKYKWKSINLTFPSGIPYTVAPFIILVEGVSYLGKVFSLSIRLFANMMSGHALLKILILFSALLFLKSNFILCLIPWVLVTLILFLESFISFLQAYVFILLITIYIQDAINIH